MTFRVEDEWEGLAAIMTASPFAKLSCKRKLRRTYDNYVTVKSFSIEQRLRRLIKFSACICPRLTTLEYDLGMKSISDSAASDVFENPRVF